MAHYPKTIGTLNKSSIYMDWVTYYDPNTGDRFEVSGMQLMEWGDKVTEELVRTKGRRLKYTGG